MHVSRLPFLGKARRGTSELCFALRLMLAVLATAVSGLAVARADSEKREIESAGAPASSGYEPVANLAEQSPYRQLAAGIGPLFLKIDAHWVQACTALAISEWLILTARHCIRHPSGSHVTFTEAMFIPGYISARSGKAFPLELKPAYEGEGTDDDFVVMKTTASIPASALTIRKISMQTPYAREDLVIIHDPASLPLRMSRKDCRATDPAVEGVQLRHICETDQGSSGAPIFDIYGTLLAIHTEGGMTPDPESYNVGLTISEIFAKSDVVRNAFGSGGSAPRPSPSAPDSSFMFAMDNGAKISEPKPGEWQLRIPGVSAVTKLVEQLTGTRSVVLWDASKDTLYEFPKTGGMAMYRKGTDLSWSPYGYITSMMK